MDIMNYSVKQINKNQFKVEKKTINWEQIICNKSDFFREVASIILDERSLYYFVSNNNDSHFLQSTLNNNQKNKIKLIFEQLIKNPEKFYIDVQREILLVKELETINNEEELNKFIEKYGLKKPKKNQSFKKRKNNIRQSINKESLYGIFGEIMLYVVVEYLMNNKDIIISKLNYISAPSTYSHGSDGIFIDKKNNVLYFGEAKFSINISSALEQALLSMKDLNERLKNDKRFLLIQESSYKNGYGIEIFDNNKIEQFKKCIIIFAFHGKEYKTEEIKKIFENYNLKFAKIIGKEVYFELISFPILSKECLKNEIAKQVTLKYESNW